MSAILYSGTKNASTWAMRAWLALREAKVDFVEQVIDIRRPQRDVNLAKIAQFSAPGAVPVLVADGVVIFDSLAIMEYANELAGGKLLPSNLLQRAHARSLLAWVHSGMSDLCCTISFESSFYPERRQMTAQEQMQAARLFAQCEQELQKSGGPYLMGELSLADLVFVPVLHRLLQFRADLADWRLTQEWSERLMARPAVQEWLTEAQVLAPVYGED